jgi:cytochrome b561
MTRQIARPHDFRTRLLHILIAVLVISQVTTSQFMVAPGKNREEDLLFEIHEYTGIVTFFLIFGLWVYTFSRARGTRPGLLFPWFSRNTLSALAADARLHLRALMKFRLPDHQQNSPLASAVHGLGILLIVLMAGTGVTWFIGMQFGNMAQSWAKAAKEVHELFSNLVWAYLIGHAGIALINHFAGKQRLSEMWSVAKD